MGRGNGVGEGIIGRLKERFDLLEIFVLPRGTVLPEGCFNFLKNHQYLSSPFIFRICGCFVFVKVPVGGPEETFLLGVLLVHPWMLLNPLVALPTQA